MSFCAELKTRFVELLKAKQAFDVAYAEDSQAVGDWQTGRWEKSLKVVKTLQNSRDGLGEAKDLKRNMEIWQKIAQGNFYNTYELTLLSDAAAEHLAKHQGTLDLSRLTKLSDTAAEHLSKNQGELELGGLTELSDTAAKHLSIHEGWLVLSGLTKLSDTAAEHLSKHQGGVLLNGLTTLSDTAAKHLSKLNGNLYVSYNIQAQIDRFKK